MTAVGDLRQQVWTGEDWVTIEMATGDVLRDRIITWVRSNDRGCTHSIDYGTFKKIVTLVLNGHTVTRF